MSSAAFINFDPETRGIPVEEWQEFCAQHEIKHRPRTIGGNVFYADEVEITWDWKGRGDITQPALSISISTFFHGKAVPGVARIACAIWKRWGGSMSAAPEVMELFWTAPALLDVSADCGGLTRPLSRETLERLQGFKL